MAVHVLVTVPRPQASRVGVSVKLITTFGSHASVTVGAMNAALAGHSIVPSGPWPERTGGVVSSIVIVWLTGVAAFPAQSIAVHVLVTVPSPHASRLLTSLELIVTFGSHASVTVGAINAAVAGHSIVPSGPWPERTGGVVSSIVIVWLTGVAALPAQSIAVHVLVTVPRPHASRLLTSLELIVTFGSHASVTVGAINAAVAGHSIVPSGPWPERTGGVVSSIVIVWLTGVAALPAQSTAVHVRVTVPRPHASRLLTSLELIVTFGSHASVTVGAMNAALAGHSIVPSGPWPLRTGGVVSSIVITCETGVAALPAQSIAVHVRVTVPSPHASSVGVSVKLITTFGSHASVTVGAINAALAGHSIVPSGP